MLPSPQHQHHLVLTLQMNHEVLFKVKNPVCICRARLGPLPRGQLTGRRLSLPELEDHDVPGATRDSCHMGLYESLTNNPEDDYY